MKKTIITAAAFLAISMNMQGQSKIENHLLQYNDTRAIVTFDLNTAENNIPSNRKEVIKPFLYNGKDTIWLDAVEVYGKNRIKRERQESKLNGDKGWELKENQTVKGITYNYSSETKVKTWMTPAHLGIKREIVGCSTCKEGLSDETVASAQMFFDPKVERRVPAEYALVEASTQWDLGSYEYEVIFEVRKTDIDSSIFHNEETFEKILEAIDKIYSHPDFKVSEIEIAGYASPEGTEGLNRWLGENRAKSLVDYIIAHRPDYGLTPENFKIKNGEENWAGLRRLTLASGMDKKDIEKIVEIIDSNNGAARKSKLKALDGGRIYAKMLKEVYPHLRNANYLAIYYDSSRDNAVEMINLANSMIAHGDYSIALETIAPYEDDFRAYNTYGVALMMNRQFEEALIYFDRAIEEGCEKAKYNKSIVDAELKWEQEKNKEREEYIKRFE